MIIYTYLQFYLLMFFAFGGGALFGAIMMHHYIETLYKKVVARYDR